MSEFDHLVMKTREALAGHIGVLSTGEALAAALVLNRFDWLEKMGYTMAQAIDRIGTEWARMIPAAAEAIDRANAVIAQAEKSAVEEVHLAKLSDSTGEIDVNADMVTYGNAPGYRSVNFTFDISRFGASTKHRLCLHVNAKDGESMAKHILDVHRSAWDDQGPIDVKEGERRPKWIG